MHTKFFNVDIESRLLVANQNHTKTWINVKNFMKTKYSKFKKKPYVSPLLEKPANREETFHLGNDEKDE